MGWSLGCWASSCNSGNISGSKTRTNEMSNSAMKETKKPLKTKTTNHHKKPHNTELSFRKITWVVNIGFIYVLPKNSCLLQSLWFQWFRSSLARFRAISIYRIAGVGLSQNNITWKWVALARHHLLKISFQNSHHLNCHFVKNNSKRKFKKNPKPNNPLSAQYYKLINTNYGLIKTFLPSSHERQSRQVHWTLEKEQGW